MKKGKDFWGPILWALIHILTAAYSPELKKFLLEFFWLLTKLLPCDYCRHNLAKKLQTYPIENYLSSRDDAFFYGYTVHDLANQHINKITKMQSHVSPPFDEVRHFYYISLRSKGVLFWGPIAWKSIHLIAATIKPTNAKEFEMFLNALTYLLPDETSRKTLSSFLSTNPVSPYLRNNHDAFFYTYIMHDSVNKKLGKKSPKFEDVKSYYFSSLGEECEDCQI